MKVLFVLVALAVSVGVSMATSAFPIRAQNYAEDHFKTINPGIEWDPTNFLVDKAGPFSLCANAGRWGSVNVDLTTRDGATVGGLIDSMPGDRADADAVTGYIKSMLSEWTRQSPYKEQIQAAKYFGCSTRPSCRGKIVVSCLFSPKYTEWQGEEPEELKQYAVAFTPEQYGVAEGILGTNWDRSHYLENLSGYETRCSMMTQRDYRFDAAQREAKKKGLDVEGFSGYAHNTGSTQRAMEEILRKWKGVGQKFTGGQAGCSLIADCKTGRDMFVVISCLFAR